MAKKGLMWTVFAVFVGVLVAGALIRTWDRTTQTAEAQGNGRGQTQLVEQGKGQGGGRFAKTNDEAHEDCDGEHGDAGPAYGQGVGRGQGAGQGQGVGQGQGAGQSSGNYEEHVAEWITVDGVVASIDDTEMTVTTTDGETVLVEGRPWQYVIDQGFRAAVGDALSIKGFFEDGEFKAGQIDDSTSGQAIQLRDETGRPGWAGQGQRQSTGQ